MLYKSFRGWQRDIGIHASLIELIDIAKTAGFEGVEIDIQEVAKLAEEKSLEHVYQLFTDADILPSGWSLPVNWQSDDATYQKGLAELPHFAEIGRRLGCVRVVTVMLSYSDARPFMENFEWHVACLQPIAEILKDHGCRLGLEYLGSKITRSGHKYEFIHSIKGTLELCDAIGTGNVGLLLDSWHWYTAQETLQDLQQLTAEQIVYVHINDAPKDVPFYKLGDGPRSIPSETSLIGLVGFLKYLGEIGYDGPVVPEPDHRFCDKIRQMSALEAARVLSEALDNLWREAGLN